MKRILLAAVLVILTGCAAHAWPASPGIYGGAVSACSKPSPVGQDDGCNGANQSALFINTAFFTNARQSGQSVYAAIPTWSVAGVDYPVGQITPDAGLLDAIANASTICPGGSYNATNSYIRCNTTADIQGYRFDDVGLFMAGTGAVVFKNNHVTMGKNTCRKFSGLEPVQLGGGTADVQNNTIDTNDDCSFIAFQYKKAGDPGLVTHFVGNITIASNTMTVNSGTSGDLAIGQYLDYAGIGSTNNVRVSANVSPGGITTCNGAACAGTTWTVCQDQAVPAYSCNVSVANVGPVNATSGPITPTANGAFTHKGGLSSDISYLYNAVLKYPTFAGDVSGSDITANYNYISYDGCCGEHNNFIVQQSAPGVAANMTFKQNFNTNVIDKEGQANFTGVLDTFATSPTANTTSSAGYQITYDLVENNYNTVVTNKVFQNLDPLTSIVRFLNQGPTAGALTNNVTFSLAVGGVATVSAFNSGPGLSVGDYLDCGVTNCSRPPKITSFISGSGGTGTYQTDNTTDTVPSTTGNTQRFPGIITQYNAIGNYLDRTGIAGTAGPYNLDYADVPVGATNISSNTNMVSGGACNVGAGACP